MNAVGARAINKRAGEAQFTAGAGELHRRICDHQLIAIARLIQIGDEIGKAAGIVEQRSENAGPQFPARPRPPGAQHAAIERHPPIARPFRPLEEPARQARRQALARRQEDRPGLIKAFGTGDKRHDLDRIAGRIAGGERELPEAGAGGVVKTVIEHGAARRHAEPLGQREIGIHFQRGIAPLVQGAQHAQSRIITRLAKGVIDNPGGRRKRAAQRGQAHPDRGGPAQARVQPPHLIEIQAIDAHIAGRRRRKAPHIAGIVQPDRLPPDRRAEGIASAAHGILRRPRASGSGVVVHCLCAGRADDQASKDQRPDQKRTMALARMVRGWPG